MKIVFFNKFLGENFVFVFLPVLFFFSSFATCANVIMYFETYFVWFVLP